MVDNSVEKLKKGYGNQTLSILFSVLTIFKHFAHFQYLSVYLVAVSYVRIFFSLQQLNFCCTLLGSSRNFSPLLSLFFLSVSLSPLSISPPPSLSHSHSLSLTLTLTLQLRIYVASLIFLLRLTQRPYAWERYVTLKTRAESVPFIHVSDANALFISLSLTSSLYSSITCKHLPLSLLYIQSYSLSLFLSFTRVQSEYLFTSIF